MAVAVDIAPSRNLSSVDVPIDPPDRLLHVSFNQDGGCFAAGSGTTSGFRVFNCDPFSELIRRDLGNSWTNNNAAGGGAGAVEMLFRTNLIALIDGGGDPMASKVLMWDDLQRRCVGAVRPGAAATGGGPLLLRGVRMARDYVAAVTDSSVYVFSFADLMLPQRHQYETAPNPRGLCALTPLGPGRVLACPGHREGQVRVERVHLAIGDARRTVLVDAHPASAVACLALSQDGRLLATAGAGCASVRVFDAGDGKLLREVSLANAASEVCSLAFSGDARFLAAAGDEGAVQVFGLQQAEEGQGGAASWFGPVIVASGA